MKYDYTLQPRGFSKPLEVPLFFAPMVGLTHSALRALVADLGGCGLFFTEMLSAKRLPSENKKISPMLCTTEREKPLVYQLYISSVDHVKPAIKKIESFGGNGVDINLGCPAPNLRREGAGAALAEDFDRVREIVKTARSSTELPLSAKIRLGQDGKSAKLLSFCKMLEGEGIDYLNVHTRFDREKFCRKPHWKLLKPVCTQLKIPVIANGGIFTVDDARKCLEESGAAGLMLGRGAVERPWLFNEIAREIYQINLLPCEIDSGKIFFNFVHRTTHTFAKERQLGRIKQFIHYIVKSKPFGHHLASKIQRSNNVEEAVKHGEDFYKINHSAIEFNYV